MQKDKYEISLWQDIYDDSNKKYTEEKICIIGSDTITDVCRAYEPKLVENVNGTNVFTFKMYLNFSGLFDSNSYRFTEFGNKFLQSHELNGVNWDLGYVQPQVVENYPNPFIGFLTNERKIKVKWKEKWYNLIITGIKENSQDKSVTYTCKDAYITELSKNGFNLTFDNELRNNQGTAGELVSQVLDGTDWTYDKKGSDSILQEQDDLVYELILQESCTAFNYSKNRSEMINGGQIILIYRSALLELLDTHPQSGLLPIWFAYAQGSNYEREANSQLVYNADCYMASLYVSLEDSTIQSIGGTTFDFTNISKNYRAKRLVQKQKTEWDPITQQYCQVWKANERVESQYKSVAAGRFLTESDAGTYRYGQEVGDSIKWSSDIEIDASETKQTTLFLLGWLKTGVDTMLWQKLEQPGWEKDDIFYSYTQDKWNTPNNVQNLIANPNNFTSSQGWIESRGTISQISQQTQVKVGDVLTSGLESYLRLRLNTETRENFTTYNGTVYNLGLKASLNNLPQGFIQGDEYICRVLAYYGNDTDPTPGQAIVNEASFQITVQPYTVTDGVYVTKGGDSIVGMTSQIPKDVYEGDKLLYTDFYCKCYRSASVETLTNQNYGFFISFSSTDHQYVWIKDIQFFKRINTTDNSYLSPGDFDKAGILTTDYFYYNTESDINENAEQSDEIEYLYHGTTQPDFSDQFDPVYTDFQKIRSISIKESNRFNILQTIAETFECWVRFDIENDDETGKIVSKNVVIKREIGKDSGIGFVYGIDLKGITRTIQSEKIVTKTIVPANTNEFATNGFCSIARSNLNYPKTNYILNFDYYISKGLLNYDALMYDLHNCLHGFTDFPNNPGFYPLMRQYNQEYDRIAAQLQEYQKELVEKESLYVIYSAKVESLLESQTMLSGNFSTICNKKIDQIDVDIYKALNSNLQNMYNTYHLQKPLLATAEQWKSALSQGIGHKSTGSTPGSGLKGQIQTLQSELATIIEKIEKLEKAFYVLYSRFLHEGTWKDDKYVDDDLYYLDAQSVSFTSSRPQVSYDISVLRVSGIDGFENKVFHLGDLAYIQDTNFFGYIKVNGIKTPYREKVILTEVTSNFDQPDKDSFKVQNYRTQFEDLFQRITASTQNLQFAQGSYARAASTINPDYTINNKVLQDSINNNANLVLSANNQTITTDATGVTVIDGDNTKNRTKITAGGIFITEDGGVTWKNALNSSGLVADRITAGVISAADLTIVGTKTYNDDGGYDAFTLNENGLTAFDPENSGAYVRLDYNGLYGIKGEGNPYNKDTKGDREKAFFSLTKDGLLIKALKKVGTEQYNLRIDTKDASISYNTATDNPRIKIGTINNEVGLFVYDNTDPDPVPVVKVGELSDTNGTFYGFYAGANGQYLKASADGIKVKGAVNATSFTATDADDTTIKLEGTTLKFWEPKISTPKLSLGFGDGFTQIIMGAGTGNDDYQGRGFIIKGTVDKSDGMKILYRTNKKETGKDATGPYIALKSYSVDGQQQSAGAIMMSAYKIWMHASQILEIKFKDETYTAQSENGYLVFK